MRYDQKESVPNHCSSETDAQCRRVRRVRSTRKPAHGRKSGSILTRVSGASTCLLLVFLTIATNSPALAQEGPNELLIAAAEGDVDRVRTLLAAGVDAGAQDANGASAFMWAIAAGSLETAKILLNAGADPTLPGVIWLDEQRTSYYGSPLAIAAGERSLELLRFLVEVVELPVNQKEWSVADSAYVGWTPLQWAVRVGDPSLVRYLASVGADLEVRDRAGETPLITTTEAGQLLILRSLLEAGADPNGSDSEGISPTHYAAVAGLVDVLEALLDAGADPNLQANDGARPLAYALAGFSVEAALMLLERGADVHAVDGSGIASIHWAAFAGLPLVVQRMLDLGADVNMTTIDGETALMFAAQSGRAQTVETLLARGADANAEDSSGWRAIHNAAVDGGVATARRLIEGGSEFDVSTRYGETPLHIAADSLNAPLCQLLMCAGADAEKLNATNQNAIDLAIAAEVRQGRAWSLPPDTSISSFLKNPYCDWPIVDLTWLVNSFASNGDIVAARLVADVSILSQRAVFGRDSPAYAKALTTLVGVLIAQGDFSRARERAAEAVALNESYIGRDHVWAMRIYNHLARLYLETEPERAMEFVETGLTHAATSGDSLQVPALLLSKAELFAQQGRLEEALVATEEAHRLNALQPVDSYTNDLQADAERIWAGIQEQNGNSAGARRTYQSAIAWLDTTSRANDPSMGRLLTDYSRFLLAHDESDSLAGTFAVRAARHWQELFDANSNGMPPSELRAFVEREMPDQVSLLFSACRSATCFPRAYELIHTWKGQLMHALREQSALATLDLEALGYDKAGTVARLRSVRREIARASVEGRDEAILDSLSAVKERRERNLVASGRKPIRLPASVTDSTLADFQSLIRPDESFVDLYRYQELRSDGEPRYVAVVVGAPHGLSVVELGPATYIDDAIGAWRQEVVRGGLAEDSRLLLHELLWEPIAAFLPATGSKVWVSPDASLARVPWNVLSHQLVTTTDSPRQFARLRNEARRQSGVVADKSLQIVGDVDFGTDSDGPFAPLPGTKHEIDVISAIAEASDRVVNRFTGDDAMHSVVLGGLGNSRYVHLATHGFFFSEGASVQDSRGAKSRLDKRVSQSRNPLSESGLAVSRANSGGAGLLTAEELVGLDLSRTELVVLSACDTGRGTEVTGQGVLGLRSSLMAAGTRSLLMSLWKVPDESTALLMESFYQALWQADMAPAAALRHAQEVVKNDPRYEAPVYWAAWVLAGEAW